MSDLNAKFGKLLFNDFVRMAKDDSLSIHEKVGFPDSYRQGKEAAIFKDIIRKLGDVSHLKKGIALEIGPGCSNIARMLKDVCSEQKCKLLWADNEAMLDLLPDEPGITEKHAGYYPKIDSLMDTYKGKVNFILCYSVLQCVFEEGNIWSFIDESLDLLAEGGVFLIGDIPNVSMRKRFFSSNKGIRFHQAFMNTDACPDVTFNQVEKNKIDDAVIFGILQRVRAQGFDAYVMPQHQDLHFANRREDILIRRP